jgi:hypothetical protein
MEDFQVYHHYYINNSIGAMIRGIADYFSSEFFDRTKEVVISTYEKGLQHWLQRKNNAGEKMAPQYPFITIDPQMDFEPDPQAGRFLWGYPNFMGKFATAHMFDPPIYDDENLRVAPILNRYRGRFDIIVWCSSVYELIDFRTLSFQMFAGQERVIQPVDITGYIVLPDEILSYTYQNPYNGDSYSLDWVNNRSEVKLIKNINQNRMVFPFIVTPWIRMTSCDDGAEKYGGTGDELSDHRMTLSCEWECSLPTHIGLLATKQPTFSKKSIDNLTKRDVKLSIDLDIGYEYSVPFHDPDTDEKIGESKITSKIIQSYAGKDIDKDDDGNDIPGKNRHWQSEVDYKGKYNYIVTQDDFDKIQSDPSENFIVVLDDDIDDSYNLRVYGKNGPMMRDYHWRVISPGTVEFVGNMLQMLKVGDMLWFAIYEAAKK